MKTWFAGVAVAGMLLSMSSQCDAQVGVRAGISSMTGLAGIEYSTGNISLGAGPLLDGQIALSARYALSAEGNSLWAGLALVLNRIEGLDSDYNIKDYPAVGPLVGYRIGLNEKLDLSIGGGYGVYLGIDSDLNEETGGALLDLSLGYRF